MDKNKTEKIPDVTEEEKLSTKMEKQLSLRKSLFRILIAILAFLWFLVGGSAQTAIPIWGSNGPIWCGHIPP